MGGHRIAPAAHPARSQDARAAAATAAARLANCAQCDSAGFDPILLQPLAAVL